MNCERCSSMRGGEAVFRIRSDVLNLNVCGQCAKEAGDLGLLVEPLSDARPSREAKEDARRGYSKTLDHRKICSSSNQRKEISSNNKPNNQSRDRTDHTCEEEVALIADYLAGRSDPTVLAAFETHLGQCPDYAAFLNTYKKTIEATKSFLKLQSLQIWPKPLRFTPKTVGLRATFIFGLHLFISNTYLTA